jgi:hypothetical protein
MFEWIKKKRGAKSGPDFSAVDSRAKAEELVSRGELHKLLLMPAEFGGPDIPQNTVYVPAFAAEMKTHIDRNIVAPLVANRTTTQYEAAPQYEGRSFVPISIKIVATNPGSFTANVAIWGKALDEPGTAA